MQLGAEVSAKQTFDCQSGRVKLCRRSWSLDEPATLTWSQCRRRGGFKMYVGYNSLWGLVVLAGDIWAVINIVQSPASNERKLIWILVVVLLPLLGLILWYFLGPRDGRV